MQLCNTHKKDATYARAREKKMQETDEQTNKQANKHTHMCSIPRNLSSFPPCRCVATIVKFSEYLRGRRQGSGIYRGENGIEVEAILLRTGLGDLQNTCLDVFGVKKKVRSYYRSKIKGQIFSFIYIHHSNIFNIS